jgi:hypothetical protein
MSENESQAGRYTYRFSEMTAEEFRAALKALRVSQGDFGELVDMSREHVNRMGRGSRTIPRSVPVLLALMRQTDVWRGDSDWRDWPPVEDQPR